MDECKKIVFSFNSSDEKSFAVIQQIIDSFESSNLELFLIDPKTPNPTIDEPDKYELISKDQMTGIDLIISVGGDGTMLKSTKLAYEFEIPITGINRGRLGFLTDINPNQALSVIKDIISGQFDIENRMLIEVFVRDSNSLNSIGYAFNDIVINRKETGRMINIETSINKKPINTHEGDGFIISTPTGSTAYSLSCGGPIMKPDVEAFLLVPIAPHTLNDRPMVLPSSSEIILRLNENQTDMVGIDIDGDTMSELKPGQELLIKKAEKTVSLLHPENYDYFDNLKSKLLWGVDNRND